MHAACMWSWDAEVIMLWEGEAGACLWYGGGTQAAWGSSPLAPGGLLRHILLWLSDLKGLEVSVL